MSPELPEVKPYSDLVDLLKSTFGSAKSLFRRRHDILSFRVDGATRPADVLNLANIKGDEFEFKDLTLDQFKIFLSLIFAAGPSFKSFRTIVLKMLDEKPEIKIDKLRDVVEQYTHRSEDAALDANSAALRAEGIPQDSVNKSVVTETYWFGISTSYGRAPGRFGSPQPTWFVQKSS